MEMEIINARSSEPCQVSQWQTKMIISDISAVTDKNDDQRLPEIPLKRNLTECGMIIVPPNVAGQ